MPVYRRPTGRPAFRPPPRRRLANGQTAASAKQQATFAGIAFLLAQFRERESLQLSLELLGVLIACPCKGADRRPARSGPPPRRRLANGQTAASAKKRAKVVQLLLKLLGVLIARPCTGVRLDARPGQGRPRGAAGRQPGWRERKKAPKSLQLSLELLFCCRNSASAKVVQLLLKLLCIKPHPADGGAQVSGLRPPRPAGDAAQNEGFALILLPCPAGCERQYRAARR